MVSFKNEKAKPKEWKLAKTDIPGPGAHKESDKAFNYTIPTSPIIKFKKDKRVIFAEATAKTK